MEYKNNPSPETLAEINKTLEFIRQLAVDLVEKEGDTKWTQGHRVFSYSDQQTYVYMVGALKAGKVSWHIMPYYAIKSLREKWAKDLKPFISGKSCINFKRFDDLPQEAIKDILVEGTDQFKSVMEFYELKRKKK